MSLLELSGPHSRKKASLTSLSPLPIVFCIISHLTTRARGGRWEERLQVQRRERKITVPAHLPKAQAGHGGMLIVLVFLLLFLHSKLVLLREH